MYDPIFPFELAAQAQARKPDEPTPEMLFADLPAPEPMPGAVPHDDGGHERVRPAVYKGQSVWVKRAGNKHFPFAPTVQRGLERVIGMPQALRCTFEFNRVAALNFEAGRLQALSERGQPVPHILARSSHALVLSDVGPSLWDVLKAGAGSFMLSEAAAMALGRLHKDGEYHGQPYPKNITWHQQRFHFIDFEDDVTRVMPLAQAQLRDVWLMVHGHWPFAKAVPNIGKRIVNAYVSAVGRDGGEALAAEVPVMTSLKARLLHTALSTKLGDNRRRYEWTLESVQQGIRARIS